MCDNKSARDKQRRARYLAANNRSVRVNARRLRAGTRSVVGTNEMLAISVEKYTFSLKALNSKYLLVVTVLKVFIKHGHLQSISLLLQFQISQSVVKIRITYCCMKKNANFKPLFEV